MQPWLAGLIAILAAAGCSGGSHYYAAEGAQVDIPGFLGCENPSSSRPGVLVVKNGIYTAVKAGQAELRGCDKGRVVVHVRRPQRLQIEGPAEPITLGPVYLSLHAYDDEGHDLLLGNSSSIEWILPEALDKKSACSHMSGFCRERWQIKLDTIELGEYTVRARYRALEASFALRFEAPRGR